MPSMISMWEIPCGDLPIVIDAEDKIEKACEILIQNGISSAPVYDKGTKSYVGMFDYRDIVDYILIVFHRKDLNTIPEDESLDIKDIVQKAMTGGGVTAKFASDLSRKNPFYSIAPNAPLSAALEILSSNGIHRVNVVDPASQLVTGILSQSDILKYLGSKLQEVGDVVKKSLKELNIGSSSPISVDCDSSVLQALSEMSKKGLSSIGVVDSGNTLIGNISMTDIKYIFKYARYTRLWQTCAHFISVILSNQGLENGGKDRVPVFDIPNTTPLGHTIKKMIATRIHRIWIVDEEKLLTGVVSLTDIIKFFKEQSKIGH